MTEKEWLTCTYPGWLLHQLSLMGGVSPRKLRLLGCACLRLAWKRLSSPRVRAAAEVAERFADGNAGQQELDAAREAAAADARRLSHSIWWGDEGTSRDVWYEIAVGPIVPCIHETVSRYTWVSSSLRSVFAFGTQRTEADLVREVFGNPFRPPDVEPVSLPGDVIRLARGIYEERAFHDLPVLADALEEAGCTSREILEHCREPGRHVAGCWALDCVLEPGFASSER